MSTTPPTSSPPTQDRIVCLDECHCEIPSFDIPHTYTGYANTPPESIAERIRDATIIITTRVPLSRECLQQCTSELRLVAAMAAGYDIIDLEACRERGIKVCNIPSASAESVAEHAFSLYLAVKRRIVELDALTRAGTEWPEKKTAIHRFGGLPKTWRSETLGIIGYGTLGRLFLLVRRSRMLTIVGKRIEAIAKALGMSVLIADRKGVPQSSTRAGRLGFVETLQKSTAILLCCPLDASTRGMIGEEELKSMDNKAILINVSRGGVVGEEALVKALKEGWIAGAATDVFATEPASATTCPLLEANVPNLTLSPHVAWYANTSIENLKATIKSNIESFVAGSPVNMV
ncbi:related to SER33-3-phosphoglycerate dehydrogenase [Phialocephala subalpina]|uniref:Related to SER33-3-phosphoglycerate dehydrogenase n=1 Tax=Phialocephala subalpina TaxID=576137 RepID=A0A1L7XT15_9HELO|nr:related to SER33-3-phosphoglycerate dehydrogenase [Phialocephala subalpina]